MTEPQSIVYNCDCLEYMRAVPDKHFALAIVDPPYFSGPERREFYGCKVSKIGVQRLYTKTETMSLSKLREKIKEHMKVGSTKAKEYMDLAATRGFLTVASNQYTANPQDRFAGEEYKLPF